MNKTAFDLIPLLMGIEAVNASSLTKGQKEAILREVQLAVPSRRACESCPETREIISNMLGDNNGRAQKPPQESTKKRTNTSKQRSVGGKSLLQPTVQNPRGPRTKKAVVNEKA